VNRFLILLKCNFNEDIKRYFEKRGVLVSFFDELLPDFFICKSDLPMEEIEKMQYVYEVKPPRTGQLLEK